MIEVLEKFAEIVIEAEEEIFALLAQGAEGMAHGIGGGQTHEKQVWRMVSPEVVVFDNGAGELQHQLIGKRRGFKRAVVCAIGTAAVTGKEMRKGRVNAVEFIGEFIFARHEIGVRRRVFFPSRLEIAIR